MSRLRIWAFIFHIALFIAGCSLMGLIGCVLHEQTPSVQQPSVGTPTPTPTPASDTKSTGSKPATTSFYSDKLAGKKTASGQPYDPKRATAAHRTLPMGTKVKVKNPSNQKEVVVEVNDRGPFVRGRELDISKSAAQSLGIQGQGVEKLEMEVVESPK